MIRKYSLDEWEALFYPTSEGLVEYLEDPENEHSYLMDYRTFPASIPEDQTWTLLDNGWIIPGRHWVNRFAYIYTHRPWSGTDEEIEVNYWED
jgi:hypothetical protein